MQVYIFPSSISRHVDTAIKEKLWAIHDIDQRQYAARKTKALNMPVGAFGIFYLSDVSAFTVPFTVTSIAEEREVRDIWPGVWHFPFSIDPHGPTNRLISLVRAKNCWRTLHGVQNVTTHLRISGSMAFVPSAIEDEDWEEIRNELRTEN